MGTLTIKGQKIPVDDSFGSLSKEQQQAVVAQVAAQIDAAPKPGSREYADWAAAEARAGRELPIVSEHTNADPAQLRKLNDQARLAQLNPGQKFLGSTIATLNGISNGVPVLGPLLNKGADAALAAGESLRKGDFSGETFSDVMDSQQQGREDYARLFPGASIAGNVAGALGTFGVGASTAAGAEALGLSGGITKQMINSFLSTVGLGTTDSIARGTAPTEALTESLAPSVFAAAVPGASATVRAAGRGVGKSVIEPIAKAFNQDNAAIKAVSNNILKDQRSGAPMISATEEAAMRNAGGDVLNVDRFGESIRRLGRTAANVSTEAGNVLRGKVQTRFEGQADRAQNFLTRLMNGATDDLALQDALNVAAQRSNRVNYDAARNSPAAASVWTRDIQDLMQSDTFRSAVTMAEKRGSDRAAAAGVQAVKNPFVFRDGQVYLRRNPDGSVARPTLEFWDQVKRNIDGMIGQAKRGGDDTLVGDLTALKRKLVDSLDATVPEYKTARGVAASFFGADDAIDAGRKAARSTRQNGEISRAVQAMTPAERDAFSVGFVSEILDVLKEKSTRQNVINQIFDSPAARERLSIALGPQKAREFEAYIRAEQIVDQARVALSGNSTTAQQLIDAGLVGGAGLGSYFMSGGDLSSAGGAAFLALAGRRGLAMLGKRVDENVMKKVAEMLASNDPAMVRRAIQNAALSKQSMAAMEAIMRGLTIGARGVALGAAASAPAMVN